MTKKVHRAYFFGSEIDMRFLKNKLVQEDAKVIAMTPCFASKNNNETTYILLIILEEKE